MYTGLLRLSIFAAFICTVLTQPHPLSQFPQIDLGYEIHEGQFNATGQFYNFSNIRYAAPPLGNLRFAPPAAPSVKTKVFNDGSNFAICPNAPPGWGAVAAKWMTEGLGAINITAGYTIPNITTLPPALPGTSEDCLFLDVLVPKPIFDQKGKGKGSPVVVWIHGGGFNVGWKTSYGSGVGLLDASRRNGNEGVIYVAMNYRLGLFGFLSGPTYNNQSGTANAGFLDQRFALEWIQKNIWNFGGDPNQVTVIGESAGGASIMHQITAYGGRKGKAPFQQAIMQSGAFLPGTGPERQEITYNKFLKAAGVQTLHEARQLPTEKLQFVNRKMVAESAYGDFTFGPVVDGTFIPGILGRLLLDNKFDKSVRVLIGHNAREGISFTSPFVFTDETFKQNVVLVSFPDADKSNVTSYILDTLYPNILDGTHGYTSPITRAAKIVSEGIFACNSQYFARAFTSESCADAHSYLFNVPPALHGQDLSYTFYEGPAATVQNDTLALIMQGYFMNFAVTGDPNGVGLPMFENYGGRMVAGKGIEMEFGLNTTNMILDDLPLDRCSWWQKALYT